MGLFLVIALLSWAVTKSIHNGRIDHTYAKQGLVSPRLQAKYGSEPAARDATARYGFSDYVKDAWSDHWQRASAALLEDREFRAANPKVRVPFRQRLAAAKASVVRAGRVLVEPVGGDSVVRAEPEPAAVPLVESGDVPPGTVRHTDAGQEQWDGTEWKLAGVPVKTPVADPVITDAELAGLRDDDTNDEDAPAAEVADVTPAETPGGTMTAPTGEAVNYETTIAELEKLAAEQRLHVDSCAAALAHIQAASGAIGDMQDSYRTSSAAAASTHEHLAALHLDGVALGHTGTTTDAMPAGAVDQMYDHLEGMEATAQVRLQEAQMALDATEANIQHLQATYGDAHSMVAGNLSGDSRFLDSGGGTNGGAAVREAVPVGAGGETRYATDRGAAADAAFGEEFWRGGRQPGQ
jgi:hypothetical protein